jgi:hypothetical protein
MLFDKIVCNMQEFDIFKAEPLLPDSSEEA